MKIFASLPILVGGKHHDIGDPINTTVDDAKALVRMGRAHGEKEEGERRKAAAEAAKAAGPQA